MDSLFAPLESRPARVLVIGSRGFYGGRIVTALRALPGVDVVLGSRTPRTVSDHPDGLAIERVDLEEPRTLGDGDRYDLIVNAADTIHADPDAAVRHVLQHGGCWLDVGADPRTTERLLAIDLRDARGSVIPGAGLFPGLSTLLAHEAQRNLEIGDDALAIDLAILLEPLSGAGDGSCELMMEALETPSVRYELGKRIEAATIGSIARHEFPGVARPHPAAVLAMPDTHLLHRDFPQATLTVSLGVDPSWFLVSLRTLATGLAIARRLGRWPRALLRHSTSPVLRLMRARLLRNRPTRIRMTATARDATNTEGRRAVTTLDVDDGQRAVGVSVAAAAYEILRNSDARPPGICTLGDCTTLAAVLETMRAVVGNTMRIDYSSSSETARKGNKTTGP